MTNRAVAPQLAKLIPRLASNHDGEVVATARAIERVLKSGGFDWHDLAAVVCTSPPPPKSWRSLARFCADRWRLLSERELNFISVLATYRDRAPSEKQMRWLNAIAARLREEAA